MSHHLQSQIDSLSRQLSQLNPGRDASPRQSSDLRLGRIVSGPSSATLASDAGDVAVSLWEMILFDVTGDPWTGAAWHAVDRSTTPVLAASLPAALLKVGQVVGLKMIAGRLWIESADIPASGGPISDPSSCIYPGMDVSSACGVCPCTADPWVLYLPAIGCGDASVGGEQPLFFDAADSNNTTCIWNSEPFTSDARTFVWTLTITQAVDQVSAELQLLDGATPLAAWKSPGFCCWCTNCFDLVCNNYFPPPCATLPREICIQPPQFADVVIQTGSGSGGGAGCPAHCPDGVSKGWTSTLPVECFPAGDDAFQGTKTLIGIIEGCCWKWGPVLDGGPGAGEDNLVLGLCFPVSLDGDVTLTFTSNAEAGSETATYSLPLADFNCDGDNTFTLTDNGGIDGAPATTTISPARFLVDIDGNLILDADGNPISETDSGYESCDPSACTCCYWVIPGDPDFTIEPVGSPAPGCSCSVATDDSNPIWSTIETLLGEGGLTKPTLLCYTP
jgi:hypothetical protein